MACRCEGPVKNGLSDLTDWERETLARYARNGTRFKRRGPEDRKALGCILRIADAEGITIVRRAVDTWLYVADFLAVRVQVNPASPHWHVCLLHAVCRLALTVRAWG